MPVGGFGSNLVFVGRRMAMVGKIVAAMRTNLTAVAWNMIVNGWRTQHTHTKIKPLAAPNNYNRILSGIFNSLSLTALCFVVPPRFES